MKFLTETTASSVNSDDVFKVLDIAAQHKTHAMNIRIAGIFHKAGWIKFRASGIKRPYKYKKDENLLFNQD